MKWVRFPRILGVTVCLYLVGMSVVFGYLSSESYRFVHTSARVQGTVVSLEIRSAAGSTKKPNARNTSPPVAPRVSYTVDGKSYEYTAAHGKYRQRLKVGDTVTVLYDPANPRRARLRGEETVLIPLITSAFVTAALGVGVLLFLTRNLEPSRAVPGRSRRRDRAQDVAESDADDSTLDAPGVAPPGSGVRDG